MTTKQEVTAMQNEMRNLAEHLAYFKTLYRDMEIGRDAMTLERDAAIRERDAAIQLLRQVESLSH